MVAGNPDHGGRLDGEALPEMKNWVVYDTSDPAFWAPVDKDDKARLRQVARYLAAHWPAPLPVRLRFERISPLHGCIGETYRTGGARYLVLRVDSRACFSWALGTLVHEWAHAVTWPTSLRHEKKLVEAFHPDHPGEWNAVHGEMTTRLYDLGGLEESETW